MIVSAGGVGVELGPGEVELTGEPASGLPDAAVEDGDISPGSRHTEPGTLETRVMAEINSTDEISNIKEFPRLAITFSFRILDSQISLTELCSTTSFLPIPFAP